MKFLIKKLAAIVMVSIMILSLTGCGAHKYENLDENKLLIVTTLFPQYDFAKHIAGDKAEVVLLLPPGTESHDFEPTPSDIILINRADLFIYTGDEMEPWVGTILESIDNENLNVLDASEGIELICEEENHEHNHVHEDDTEEHEDEHAHEDDEADHGEEEHDEDSHSGESIILGETEHDHSHTADPHIWTSPVNAIKMASNIAEAIVECDEENSAFYLDNCDEYTMELKEIDAQLDSIVSNSDTKTIYFGGRFAMSYFAREYGLSYVAAFDSCQAESEPSARLVVKIIEKMREDKALYVFYEEMTDPKAARIIAEEIGGEILLLHSCHNVSKSEMEAGVTYLSLMKQNVENLRKALD